MSLARKIVDDLITECKGDKELIALLNESDSSSFTQEKYQQLVKQWNKVTNNKNYSSNTANHFYQVGLRVLCGREFSSDFVNGLNKYIMPIVCPEYNFFLVTPERRCLALTNMRDRLTPFLVTHKSEGGIFLVKAVNEKAELIRGLCKNRLGQHILMNLHAAPVNFNLPIIDISRQERILPFANIPSSAGHHLHAPSRREEVMQFLAILISLREAARARRHQMPVALPKDQSRQITEIFEHKEVQVEAREKFKLNIEGFEDLRCGISQSLIPDEVVRVKNGETSSGLPKYQYYRKENFNAHLSTFPAGRKPTDPLTRKELEKADIEDYTEKYRDEFMKKLGEKFTEKGIPENKIPFLLAEFKNDIFDKKFDPSVESKRRAP